ncbi:MAG: DUF177 domain-containing protein [Pseudobdellovibrionaceae bacterium]
MPPKSGKTKKKGGLPWSYFYDTRDLDGRAKLTINPEGEELEALVAFLGVDRLEKVKAEYTLTQAKGAYNVQVEGRVRGTVHQTCVITLEPITSEVDESFEAYYADYTAAVPFSAAKKALYAKFGMAEIPVLDEKDDPEPMERGMIDLGELATQYLSLSIDPYAQKEGAVNADAAAYMLDEAEQRTSENPFAALKGFMTKGEGTES